MVSPIAVLVIRFTLVAFTGPSIFSKVCLGSPSCFASALWFPALGSLGIRVTSPFSAVAIFRVPFVIGIAGPITS